MAAPLPWHATTTAQPKPSGSDVPNASAWRHLTYSARLRSLRKVGDCSSPPSSIPAPPPCIDFSRAGCRRGTDGKTGHLFLEDAEAALEADLPVVISEIVLGILTEALIHFLQQKVARLRTKYRTEWRIFRCNRNGDLRTNRRRVIIVGVKPKFISEHVTSLLPSERPPALPVGLVGILESESAIPSDLVFTQHERIVQAPARVDSG